MLASWPSALRTTVEPVIVRAMVGRANATPGARMTVAASAAVSRNGT